MKVNDNEYVKNKRFDKNGIYLIYYSRSEDVVLTKLARLFVDKDMIYYCC